MTEDELNAVRAEIARTVREKRELMNISQVKLAEITGMGIATIKRFESGRWINMKQFLLIKEALQLPLF